MATKRHFMSVEVLVGLQRAVKKAAKTRGILFSTAVAEALWAWVSAQKEPAK